MIKFILWYLFLGVVFNFIVDMSTEYAKKRGVVVPDSDKNWNWSSRIVAGLIWPIGLVYYLRGYIHERYKNKK
jgi:hypothetical protein